MGNADSLDRGTSTGGWIDDAEVGSASEIVGNASGVRSGEPTDGIGQAASWVDASSDEDMGNTTEQRQQRSGRTNDARGTINRPAEPDGGCSNGTMEQSEWQVEPSLGGNSNGTPRGMDYAELSVTCDNRTDELRLLGNGVVPATATLAFQTLLAELLSP
jgi:hypothetical protein